MPYKYDKDGWPIYSPLVGRIYRYGEKREWDWVDFLGNSFGVTILGALSLVFLVVGFFIIVTTIRLILG